MRAPLNSIVRCHLHPRTVALLLTIVSFGVQAAENSIIGAWTTYARAFEGMTPILVTEDRVSINGCVNASYSVFSDETITAHWLYPGKVRIVTLKLNGVGCSDPKDPNEFLRFEIPLERASDNELVIAFCQDKKSVEVKFGCSGIFRREPARVTPNKSLERTREG